jgi:hypothetical protein
MDGYCRSYYTLIIHKVISWNFSFGAGGEGCKITEHETIKQTIFGHG